MPAIGQEQILVGDELRLYVGSDIQRSQGSKTSRDRIPIAFASDCTVTYNSELLDANNKDVKVYRTLVPVLLGGTIETTVFQSLWDGGRTEIEDFSVITAVDDVASVHRSRITTRGNTQVIPNSRIDSFIEFGETGIVAEVKATTTRTFDVAYLFTDEQKELLKGVKKLYHIDKDADRLNRRTVYDLQLYYQRRVPLSVEFGVDNHRFIGRAYISSLAYSQTSNTIAMADLSLTFTGRFVSTDVAQRSKLFGFGSSPAIARGVFFNAPRIYYTKSDNFNRDTSGEIYLTADTSGTAPVGYFFDGAITYHQT